MKIALCGSAPASSKNAPYGDSSWHIIGCSPGLYGVATRINEWFETHLWEPGQTWFSPEYCQWLKALPGRNIKLWVGGKIDDLHGSEVFPFDDALDKYDKQHWFCSSSLFWMMIRAIELIEIEAAAQGRPISPDMDKIAFFGVDMAAGEEYEMQRAGIHFLTYRAAGMGIEVGAPHESDLFTPRFRYGADEWTHSYRKIRARNAELNARLQQSEMMVREHLNATHFLKGAIDDLKYMGDTWADKGQHLGPAVTIPPVCEDPTTPVEAPTGIWLAKFGEATIKRAYKRKKAK